MSLLEPVEQAEDLVGRTRRVAAAAAVLLAHVVVHLRGGGVDGGIVRRERAVLHHGEDSSGADLHLHGGRAEVHVVHVRRHDRDGLQPLVLQRRIERRVDLHAAAAQVRRARVVIGAEGRVLQQDRAHVLAEELGARRVLATLAAVRDVRRDGRGHRVVVLLLRDLAVGQHAAQHVVASVEGQGVAVGLAVDRVTGLVGRRPFRHIDAVDVGSLHHTGDRRRLRDRQIGCRDAEVVLCRGADAVDEAAEVGDVQVAQQDLVLGVLLLELDRVPHLLQLALVALSSLVGRGRRVARRDFVGVLRLALTVLLQHVLDILLGDRRASAVGTVGGVAHERAQGADEVDAAVRVEVLVLAGGDRVVHDGVDLVERHRDAVLVVELRHQCVVAVRVLAVHLGRQHERIDLEEARHVLERVECAGSGVAGDRDRRCHGGRDEDAGDGAQTDESRNATEHTGGRPFELGHRLDRKGEPWGIPRCARARHHWPHRIRESA